MARALFSPLLLAAALAAPAAADCTYSMVGAGCFDIVMQPMFTSTGNLEGHAWTAGTPCDGACFDLPNGAMHAENAWNIYGGPCTSEVEMIDDYQLLGGVPGQAYPCQAILQVTANIVDPGGASGRLMDLADVSGQTTGGTNTPGADRQFSVVLPLTFIAGQVLRLDATLLAGGSSNGGTTGGSAMADGVLRFAGLPHGVSVTSCRAYNLPVPAEASTWGSLKATYR